MADTDWQADEQRWEREAEYFDSQTYSRQPVPDVVIERYRACADPFLAAEYPYWRLGDVRDKRILDVGCGDGTNALLLALKGASVVGIDLSERAIEAAIHRARLHNLGNRARFVRGPIETVLEGESSFDIITGFAVLHHLIPVLNQFLHELDKHARPGTQFLFMEPVNLSPGLRKLRLRLPVSVSGTPDERPLEAAEIEIIQRHFRKVEVQYFHASARIADRFLLRNRGYETAPWASRFAYRTACRFDRLLFEIPFMRNFSSVAVISAWI